MTPPNRVGCAIAGGGPAGMMLGFLLARAGIEVAVLEKNRDFLRDFRGDTDGRHSVGREKAGLRVESFGAPIDVLWMRLSKQPGDPPQAAGRFNYGRLFVTLDRGDYLQCAYVIKKGGYDLIRERGIDAL